MFPIAFVDAHVHLWQLDGIRYPWLTPPFDPAGPNGSVEAIARDYLVDDYLGDVAEWNVVGAVHVDAGADPAQALDETVWLERMAADRGLPTAIDAHARLGDPSAADILSAQASYPRVRGIRQIVNWHGDAMRTYTHRDLTRDERWRAGFALLEEHGLSFDLQCYPGQMPEVAALIARHPGIPVIVNHLGMPVLTDPDGIEDWRRGMGALAAVPHVSVKISGLGFIDRRWTLERVRPIMAEAVDLFGTTRCLFATDAPTDTLFAPLDRYLEAYRTFAAAFSSDEQRDMWGRNADRVYRLALSL